MNLPLCSLIVVQYGNLFPLKECLESIWLQTYPAAAVELLVVDNGSCNEAQAYLAAQLSRPALLNDQNNYARALNLAIEASRGEYVAFINNDVILDPAWLKTLVEFLEKSPQAAAAGGKILLADSRINSVGLEDVGDFRWQDEGFEQEDRGQYDKVREVQGLCWASVLFRRSVLAEIGPVDEDFVMYYEDVEYAFRCRQEGWKLYCVAAALSRHGFRASSRGSLLTDYFCNRNRLLFIAKHKPQDLSRALETWAQCFSLEETLPHAIEKLLNTQSPATQAEVLPQLCEAAFCQLGAQSVDGVLARAQIRRGHRRISIGIYDHALHCIGGGQKYAATMAEILQAEFDVTFIANRPVRLSQIEDWYRLDLSSCRLKIVKLPFFDNQEIDPIALSDQGENPFQPVSEESSRYDIFVNANMADKVAPASPLSLLICHFPTGIRSRFFSADLYSQVISSGQYGANWCQRRWGVHSSVLYPAVEFESRPIPKERVILSCARFERSGSKRQRELIANFRTLIAEASKLLSGWRLVLAGGSNPNNPYLLELIQSAKSGPGTIEILPNLSVHELEVQYARADLFWHACGLDETEPDRVEHFGMTTLEAMQNRCVPIVIGAGGQLEIVEHGRSGLLFNSGLELRQQTLRILGDAPDRERLREGAWRRSQQFRRPAFEAGVRRLFGALKDELIELRRPDPGEIMRRTSL